MYLLKNKKYTLLSLLLLCFVNLGLVLQLLPFGEVLYADRYMYLPTLFFTLSIVYPFYNTTINTKVSTYTLLILLAIPTFLRLNVWKSSINLYSDILKKFPNSFVALNSL